MIQKAQKTDVKQLYQLETSLFSKEDFGLSLQSFYYHISTNNLFIFLEKGKIVGYILWLHRKRYYRLYSICVDKNFQGKGIAQKLLDFSFTHLRGQRYQLEVKQTNYPAIKLYERNGFVIKKSLKEFYPNNVDGYLMVKEEKDIIAL